MLSRRSFLKLTGAALAGSAGLTFNVAKSPEGGTFNVAKSTEGGTFNVAKSPEGGTFNVKRLDLPPEDWWALQPNGEPNRLGRITAPQAQLMSRPHPDGARVGWLLRDEVVRVVQEVVGKGWFPHNHVWVETPDGFVYSSLVQPVRPLLNQPLRELPPGGLWTECSAPYAEGRLAPDPVAESRYRLYYAMVLKVDGIAVGPDGEVWYRILDENSDVRLFAHGKYLRPIQPQEFEAISPGVDGKLIRVDLKRQRLRAFEGQSEVFWARVASGVDYFDPDGNAQGSLTRPGSYPIWSKRASRHMVGGTPTDGYDLLGVGWVSYFASYGAAIHSTYWHNDFGRPKSHGCLNMRPEDARWLFRWTLPPVPYLPGDVTVQWPGGTRVVIEEG
ncbi:MAG: L,D-transpeptidase [Chloroflexi bacterium]|nr:L,D-transpeptidase [Chloroflexota bacterium]